MFVLNINFCFSSAELGDYNPERHVDDFVSQFRFVPNQVRLF